MLNNRLVSWQSAMWRVLILSGILCVLCFADLTLEDAGLVAEWLKHQTHAGWHDGTRVPGLESPLIHPTIGS